MRCHGCTTGRREDWSYPGDRYELEKQHWVKVGGPSRAIVVEGNLSAMRALRAMLGRPTLFLEEEA
jgi:hypothetical protein